MAASALVGCNSLVGLDQFTITQTGSGGAAGSSTSTTSGSGGSISGTGGTGGGDMDAGDAEEPRVVECHTNQECTDRATAAATARYEDAGPPDGSDAGPPSTVPAMCVQSIGKCVELLSDDCKTITGNYIDDNAILLGSLFSTSGTTASTNIQRQQSATLAIEEINNITGGGIPGKGGIKRPLVMLSCDEAVKASRAATHLIDELHVPAIVGPNTSQDTLDLSNTISLMGGTVMMTPSGVAQSIADLSDPDDLTWQMAPTDVQRARLMIDQINAIEAQLKVDRNKSTIKFGIIYRDDALGQGTKTALVPLQINGRSLTEQLGTAVHIDAYAPTAMNQDALVATYRTFAPDIIALAGTAEAITLVMNPLEATWNTEAGSDRPYYVLIDSLKVPQLFTAAAANQDLRSRVRGTGIASTGESKIVNDAFKLAYAARYSNQQPSASSTGPSYDAAYAIAYALTATKDLPVTGKNVALGLRKLAGGTTMIDVGKQKATLAFNKLSSGGDGGGENITAIGTFSPLEWDSSGAPASATLEMWCVTAPEGGTPGDTHSGLYYDLKTKQYSGTYTQCP
jgi:branched-chain amino acid transport system substrate-binding protein